MKDECTKEENKELGYLKRSINHFVNKYLKGEISKEDWLEKRYNLSKRIDKLEEKYVSLQKDN